MPHFQYRNPRVEARRLTVGNLAEIESWCGGSIRGTRLLPEQRVLQYTTHGVEYEASVGDWIVKAANLGTVWHLSDRNFRATFQALDGAAADVEGVLWAAGHPSGIRDGQFSAGPSPNRTDVEDDMRPGDVLVRLHGSDATVVKAGAGT